MTALTLGLLVVGLADNVLKPILMGRGLNTPMLVIFIGVLGGMLAHGILGLFVGPIILAVTWELMMAWIREERADAAGCRGLRAEGKAVDVQIVWRHLLRLCPDNSRDTVRPQ